MAATMLLARLAGIRVSGTGGLGGVHRGYERYMDVSADLTELARTRVAVVSSGCKTNHAGPSTVCLYCAVRLRLAISHTRSR